LRATAFLGEANGRDDRQRCASVAIRSEEPITGFLQAVCDGSVLEPPLADEGFAPRFDLFARAGAEVHGAQAS
jgi:hypothetical protein